MVHQCTKFHCLRTNHKQVIGTNIIYRFFLWLFVVVICAKFHLHILSGFLDTLVETEEEKQQQQEEEEN